MLEFSVKTGGIAADICKTDNFTAQLNPLRMQVELGSVTAAKGGSKLEMRYSDGILEWKLAEESEWKPLVDLSEAEYDPKIDRVENIYLNALGELIVVYQSGREINIGSAEGLGITQEQKRQLEEAYSHSQNDKAAQPLNNLEIEALIRNMA